MKSKKKGKGKGKGWRGEPTRHKFARMGIKTVIDDERRFDVSKFVARGDRPNLTAKDAVWSIIRHAQEEDDYEPDEFDDVEFEVEPLDGMLGHVEMIEVGNYVGVLSYDDVIALAEEQVYWDLENNPEFFDIEWLKNHAYIGEVDKRCILADEFNNFYDMISEDHPNWGNDRVEKEAERRLDDVKERLEDDPFEYFEELGYDTKDIIDNFMWIDKEKASHDAVNVDGAGHFLNQYDGEIYETPEGVYYWRID